MKKVIYFLVLLLFSCKTQEFPPKHTDLSNHEYDKYCKKLKEARGKKDYFWAGSALANLKESPKKVYTLLHKSIRQHDTLCYQIHDYQYLHKSGSLTVSIIKTDTLRWKKLCAECEKIVPLENYYTKKEKETLAYKKKQALHANKLDTNLIDKKLTHLLSDMMYKDQVIRKIPFMDSENPRWKEQKYLDSLNLVQLDSIFKIENGYPKLEKVGYDAISVPWYVLHHQSDTFVRRKYQHFIEEAVKKGYLSQGMLDGYNERTLTFEGRKSRP